MYHIDKTIIVELLIAKIRIFWHSEVLEANNDAGQIDNDNNPNGTIGDTFVYVW